MRFTITALGSAGGRTVGKVVGDIVRYLQPRLPERPAPGATPPTVPSGEGPSSYYADRGTEPGRWLGYGAGEAGLTGIVDPGDFARVLAGRDPHTDARLVTAQGSAGRRPTLGVGQHTQLAETGVPLYNLDDATAALGLERRDTESLVANGERVALAGLFAAMASRPSRPEPGGSFLVPRIDADGTRWVTGPELDRCEDARQLGTEPELVSALGQPDDQFSVAEAARLAGVIPRYIRRLCRRWEDNQSAIEAELAAGRVPTRNYIVGHKGTGNRWRITRRELVAFLERRHAPAVRVGFDLTLTTEKSLGVLALLGSDQTREAVLDAVEAGNDAGLGYIEYHASGARAKSKPVLARGLTIASFRHLTSRALDPFPHHHNVIANTVIDEHGTRRALDARGLFQHAQAASAIATIAMRHQLTQNLGVSWRRGRSGHWEIDGIPDEVLREFSQRRNEIEDAIVELEAEIGRRSTLDEVQTVITGTRPAKDNIDPSRLVEGWWSRARDRKFTPRQLEACTGRQIPARSVVEERLFLQLASPTNGVCAGQSLFTRSDVLSVLADLDYDGHGPLVVLAQEVERLADGFLASRHVLQLDTRGLTGAQGRDEWFTTAEILEVQRRIADHYQASIHAHAAEVPDPVIDNTLTAHPELIEEQRALVRALCTSGQALQCAIGRAGAGKTTTMQAAGTAWTNAGYDVVGAAVKGEAARQLAAGAGIPTETVAWYLARDDQPPLHDRSVLIVDEASTISDRDLDALLHLAKRSGATVRLIGDPNQHGAVTAGGMFHYLCATHRDRTPELQTTHRVLNAADRKAARLLRQGRSHEALALLARADHLHVADNDLDLYLGMLRQWWDAHQVGAHHPMVDRRHRTRRVLNRLARQLRRANGELGDIEISATGDRHFAVGDRIVARMAARHLHVPDHPTAYVRNGATGTVTAVHTSDSRRAFVEVDFDDIGTIRLPRTFLDEHDGPGGRRDVGIDHAYAVTSYAIQGATFDLSTSRIDEAATRSEAYVDITRGRQANHLFVTRSPDPLDGEHLPKAPDPLLHQTVGERLRRSGPERAAIEFAILDPPTAMARLPSHDPPRSWASRHPPPAAGPVHVRRRRDAAIAAALQYRLRWQPRPGSDNPWDWALGSAATDSQARHDRDRATIELDSYARIIAVESLTAVGLTDEQFIENLRFAISTGLPSKRLAELAEICVEIDHRRRGPIELAIGDPVPIRQLLRELDPSVRRLNLGGRAHDLPTN